MFPIEEYRQAHGLLMTLFPDRVMGTMTPVELAQEIIKLVRPAKYHKTVEQLAKEMTNEIRKS